MKKRVLKLLICLLFLNILWIELYSQEKEDLLFEEIPVVITASRRAQPITESPSTITIIDAEDIRQSGATTIPDILRMVGGVEVMSISFRDTQVSARGLNSSQSNKLLVMIDGRSVYKDLYGSVLWDLFPVILDDIQRIEVVRSPVSSLYGANAFSGVVNIITKSPESSRGTQLKLNIGNYNTLIASVLHAGGGNRYNYKLSIETNRTDEWQGEESAGNIYKFNGQLDIILSDKCNLSFSGGRVEIGERKLFADYEFGVKNFSGSMDYVQLNFDYGKINVRSFISRMDADLRLPETESDSYITAADAESHHDVEHVGNTTTYDIELLHRFNIRDRHAIVWGLNFRTNTLEKSILFSNSRRQQLWAFFFEDEFKINKQLRLTAGGRFDTHPIVKEHFSPRATLLWSPGTIHTFRLSYSRAYRNPAFVNSYLNFNLTSNYPLPAPLPPLTVPVLYSNQGNELLDSEQVAAYELAYLWRGVKGLQLNINMFYNVYCNFFITTRQFTFYESGELFPGSPGSIFPKHMLASFENSGGAKGMGGELSLEMKLSQNFSCFANYAFLQIKDERDNIKTTLINEMNRIREDHPQHKINAGLRVKLKPGISFNLLMHWLSASNHYIFYPDGQEYLVEIDDYLLVNIRLGWLVLDNRLEFSLAVFNLFKNRHYEFPPGIDPASLDSHLLGRRFNIGFRYKF